MPPVFPVIRLPVSRGFLPLAAVGCLLLLDGGCSSEKPGFLKRLGEVESLQRLQGEWLAVAAEENGRELDKMAVLRERRRVIINGTSMLMERFKDGDVGAYNGKFDMSAEKGAIDWIGKDPKGSALELIGRYQLEGEELRLCLRYNRDGAAQRPKGLSTADDPSPNTTVMYVLKRQGAANSRSAAPASQVDAREVMGKVVGGAEKPVSQAKSTSSTLSDLLVVGKSLTGRDASGTVSFGASLLITSRVGEEFTGKWTWHKEPTERNHVFELRGYCGPNSLSATSTDNRIVLNGLYSHGVVTLAYDGPHVDTTVVLEQATGEVASSAGSSSPAVVQKRFLVEFAPTEKRLQNGWFEVGAVWGVPISHLGGRGRNSIFLHAQPNGYSAVSYWLGGRFDTFEAGVLIPKVKEEQRDPATPLVFQVWGDGEKMWQSPPVARMNQFQDCRVSIRGINTLQLRVACPGRDNWAVAVWFEPLLLHNP